MSSKPLCAWLPAYQRGHLSSPPFQVPESLIVIKIRSIGAHREAGESLGLLREKLTLVLLMSESQVECLIIRNEH